MGREMLMGRVSGARASGGGGGGGGGGAAGAAEGDGVGAGGRGVGASPILEAGVQEIDPDDFISQEKVRRDAIKKRAFTGVQQIDPGSLISQENAGELL